MRGHLPGEDWQIDFTHMPKHKKLRYLLTIIDTFTGWIEASPTLSEGASTVAEILLKDVIPHFGLPRRIQSDNGPCFHLSNHPTGLQSFRYYLETPHTIPPPVLSFPVRISSNGGPALFPHSNLRSHILWHHPYTRRKQPDQIRGPLSPIRGWNVSMSLEGDNHLASVPEETLPARGKKLKGNQSPSASTTQRRAPSSAPEGTEGQPITEQQHNLARKKDPPEPKPGTAAA
ncbi:uncharacterized protein LOC121016655 [Herpailurus yagouaroundi]|uniref:uncharacterized protein LOC121016655 n=1 Tax=Herpailurus yagouaroundi TaxID=1608482 RepID=UPI001AD700BC|nr:uncharacterized protein LOC121016655 [Puma yagouaroundi]